MGGAKAQGRSLHQGVGRNTQRGNKITWPVKGPDGALNIELNA